MKREKWTLHDMPDQSGKVVIVTGGNSGLGYESVKAFAEKGARVIMACRSAEKGEMASNRIREQIGDCSIEVMELDLMDFASIKRFSDRIINSCDRLDVLMNNAGIIITRYALTKDGLEAQNGANHFGHFALTGHLVNLLIKTRGSRVVNVSSNIHKYGKMDFNNLLFKGGKGYTRLRSYARSKLANLLFTYELQRRFIDHFTDCRALAAHPGYSLTNVGRDLQKARWLSYVQPLADLITQDQARGALPQIRAAVDPGVIGGEYFGPDGILGMKGHPVPVRSSRTSRNRFFAKTLWKVSEEITGVRYL